jgi:hypothetical protein
MATRRQQITRSAAVKNAEEKNGQTSPFLPRKQESKNQEGKNREGECLWRLAGGKKNEVGGAQERSKKEPAEESTTMKTREQTPRRGSEQDASQAKNQEEGGIGYLSRQPESGKGRMAGRYDTGGRTTTTHGEEATWGRRRSRGM